MTIPTILAGLAVIAVAGCGVWLVMSARAEQRRAREADEVQKQALRTTNTGGGGGPQEPP